MRIGYFGGSFDPPHNGHLTVACAARDRFALDRVLLAPTGRQPLKPNGAVASFADRLRMTELLCAGVPRLEASPIDAPRPDGQPNYTVDTLRRLHAQLAPAVLPTSNLVPSSNPISPPHLAAEPNLHLFAILGADAFQTFPHWREPEELLQLAEWIIVSRPGVPLPTSNSASSKTGMELDAHELASRPEQPKGIHLLNDIVEPVSATQLRFLLRDRQDCQGMMPKPVLSYIAAHRIYVTGRC